jgi:hypothetical protein
MKNTRLLKPVTIAATIGLMAVAVFAFVFNEARKEVYFLCGNFKEGVSHKSVIRQLETANLSGYSQYHLDSGARIVHSSSLNFHLFRCSIEFNRDGFVMSAAYG